MTPTVLVLILAASVGGRLDRDAARPVRGPARQGHGIRQARSARTALAGDQDGAAAAFNEAMSARTIRSTSCSKLTSGSQPSRVRAFVGSPTLGVCSLARTSEA